MFFKFSKSARAAKIPKAINRFANQLDSKIQLKLIRSIQTLNFTHQTEQLIIQKPVIYISKYTEEEDIVNKIIKTTATTATTLYNKFLNFVKYARRIFVYFLYGAPAVGLYGLQHITGSSYVKELTWDYILFALNKLGPFFIKMGQWASTRPDLFSEELIERLETLQDGVNANIDYNAVDLHLEQLLGPTWSNNLSYSKTPIGLGSIGCVLKGQIHYNEDVVDNINASEQFKNFLFNKKHPTHPEKKTKDVAIKIIHPTSKDLIQTDMELLVMFANYLDTYPDLKMLALGETLKKFSSVMNSQLNLNNEGQNLQRFNVNFNRHTNVKFPQYITSSENILIESFINGIPLKTIMKDKEYASMYEEISDSILDGAIKQVFADNFIHGDLHPGNIMVDINTFKTTGGKIIPVVYMLDCGIVYEFENKQTHQKIAKMSFLLMKHNGYNAGLFLIDDNTKLKLVDLMKQYKNDIVQLDNSTELKYSSQLANAHEFCKNIQNIVEDSEKENAFQNASSYTERLIRHAKKCEISLESDMLQLILASKVVEGIFLNLTPNMTLISAGIPKVIKHTKLSDINFSQIVSL